MRLTIDATSLLLPSAGVKTHLYYWISALREAAAAARGVSVALYPPWLSRHMSLDHRSSPGGARSALGLSLVRFANIRGNPAVDLLLAGTDVFHCSQHTARRPKRPAVTATIFDLSCWATPEFHTAANIAATKRYAEKILKTSDGLIANSQHVRDAASDLLGIPPARMRVIYPGVAERWFAVSDDEAAAVRSRFDLARPYLLFVGCIEPRKNVPGLLRAYRRLPEAVRRHLELVVAGPFGWASEATRAELAQCPGARYLGYVPEDDLPGLCRGASALVYPSFYEGFGLPMVEAMAAGTPVIAAARSCLPEVAGGAALLVDPDSTEEIAAAMERMVTGSELAQRLSALGRQRAARFHWSKAAAESLDFFRQAAGRRS